ncbi:unnamed protein product [Allacma fusca]|uniref:FAD-binding PCMH-type domain-containing protein n=1 Tax=Allacma fusca TaxID=39272 RepID=A0A8J2NJD5_9HEXA|nr:unnamed protein product [Allacma fusca]
MLRFFRLLIIATLFPEEFQHGTRCEEYMYSLSGVGCSGSLIISEYDQNVSFWAQPGILLGDLLRTLKRHKLGFLNHPVIGEITLGGALAIGAHGTGIPIENESLSKGHTY